MTVDLVVRDDVIGKLSWNFSDNPFSVHSVHTLATSVIVLTALNLIVDYMHFIIYDL